MTIKDIQSIIKDFEKSSLRTLEIEVDGVRIKLSKNEHEKNVLPKDMTHLTDKPTLHTTIKSNETTINAPLVGTYYSASTPGGKPFVSVGQKVKKGDIVCIIEAMKIMNEITANTSGTISEIFVTDKEVVSFDQTLMTIVKDHEK